VNPAWLALLFVLGFMLGFMLGTASLNRTLLRQADELGEQDALIAALRSGVGIPVEQHPVWSMPVHDRPLPTLEESLGVVVARGKMVRLCRKCKSPATDIDWQGFQWSGTESWAHVTEECGNCGNTEDYRVPPALWTSMEAARTWEAISTANALFVSTESDDLELE
jgi:hypothetical protein